MAMSVGTGGGEPEVMLDVNTTPLIDVMLVLLVMLIITVPVQTHAVKLDMPVGNPPPPPTPPVVHNVDIDFDGTVTWDSQVVDRQQLDALLTDAADQPDPKPEVHLRPNKLVKYANVATVLADAQRLGVKKLGVVGGDQFTE